MRGVMSDHSVAQELVICQHCGHIGSRFDPVQCYRERISGDRVRASWHCRDAVMCAARWDQQHGFGRTLAVQQQLATRPTSNGGAA